MRSYFVYIITNKRNGTLYIGMTYDISRRMDEHQNGLVKGFSKLYGLKMLVFCEEFKYVYDAIERENQLKKWNRRWKMRLIESVNREREDFKESM